MTNDDNSTVVELDAEDAKLLTLARGARGRVGAAVGAAVGALVAPVVGALPTGEIVVDLPGAPS